MLRYCSWILEGKCIPELKERSDDLKADGQKVVDSMANLSKNSDLIKDEATSKAKQLNQFSSTMQSNLPKIER